MTVQVYPHLTQTVVFCHCCYRRPCRLLDSCCSSAVPHSNMSLMHSPSSATSITIIAAIAVTLEKRQLNQPHSTACGRAHSSSSCDTIAWA